jgi:Transposase, Mutator family
MRRRGLPDPLLVISDGALGLIRAIEECFPRPARQRCFAHELRNLQSNVPEDQWPEFKARAIASYQAASPALARMLRDDIAVTYGTALPSALTCLQDDFEACTAHCARYTPQTRLSSKARTGPRTSSGLHAQSGLAASELAQLGAMAIMTNAVETNRILGSPLKLIYYTSFSHELY